MGLFGLNLTKSYFSFHLKLKQHWIFYYVTFWRSAKLASLVTAHAQCIIPVTEVIWGHNKEVGHTFVVMVCILPILNSLWHHFGIVIFDAYVATQQSFVMETYFWKMFFP